MAHNQLREPPSEETPLIENQASQDEEESSVSSARGMAIAVVMGLLLFTQGCGNYLLCGLIG
ncbi:hypothetical protein PHISCL_06004 [Aspergillus sclerotialis]|uniref:Uncharacterized protein n=1 Tax=Aspergillus sclerotialis TaxID=2070753 RepID=A0A3A2ZQT2_9EURO|nr:hypothetical protein PHISCL_06004 [Aspergillus sclerotialis]